MKNNILYIVVPCYNEEEILNDTNNKLLNKLNDLINKKIINKNSKIMYVDDGSKDNTWNIIEHLHKTNKSVTGISLSRNEGHQNALYAGLMISKTYADIVISIDADLQDDINVINEMIKKYISGCEIVYGVRNSRKKDTFLKRITAESFYKLMKFMGAEIIYNHADFRLTNKRVLNCLEEYKEVNLFLRGIFPTIGFKSDIVYYERNKRMAGKSKYNIKKMLTLAWNGITSFSIKPLKMILNIGFIINIPSLIMLLIFIIMILLGKEIQTSNIIICSIYFIGSLNMIALGLVGQYISKIYSEVKARPKYFISRNLNKEKEI